MKVVFVGPSLRGIKVKTTPGLEIRGPAEMGDVERAVRDGFKAIGLIDGHFQQVGSVWHKEILFALAAGVAIFGGASMGALRAAECRAFGMIPVGKIADDYCRGTLVDDSDVAVTNAPAELDFAPLTEPLVDAQATLERLAKLRLISSEELRHLIMSAKQLYFADRTDKRIVSEAKLGERTEDVLLAYRRHHVSLKHRDALQLIRTLQRFDPKQARQPNLLVNQSAFWQHRPDRHRLPS
jgi:hypothetical protein